MMMKRVFDKDTSAFIENEFEQDAKDLISYIVNSNAEIDGKNEDFQEKYIGLIQKYECDETSIGVIDFCVFIGKAHPGIGKELLKGDRGALQLVSLMYTAWSAATSRSEIMSETFKKLMKEFFYEKSTTKH